MGYYGITLKSGRDKYRVSWKAYHKCLSVLIRSTTRLGAVFGGEMLGHTSETS